jgi:dephospho-CoA kinase
MLIVGLTGGIGSGKTIVSRILREEGARVIDLDRIARELVQPRAPAWVDLKRAFSPEIFQEDGSLDRKRLAARVFSDPGQRELLHRILHPRIREELARRLKEIGQKESGAIVVIDAALLVETGDFREMDKLIVVTSTEEQQIERLRERDGATPEEARRIISSQMPLEEKLKVADLVIRNEGSLEEKRGRVREVFQALKRFALQKERGGPRPPARGEIGEAQSGGEKKQ